MLDAKYMVALCGVLSVICGCGDSSVTSGTTTGAIPKDARYARTAFPPLARVEGGPPHIQPPHGPPSPRLRIIDRKVGAGSAARPGDELTVQFAAIRYVSGKPFESSWENGHTFHFELNSASVSPGWVKGLQGMRVGGQRELIVPPREISRYGVPPGTGPENTLIYVIDLLEARPPNAVGPPSTAERARPRIITGTGRPPNKLIVKEIQAGTGAEARDGDELTVYYFGYRYTTGKLFTAGSWRYGPHRFVLGAGHESPAWERGIAGMRVGGRRRLLAPPRLSSPYGAPPGAAPAMTLEYVIDLIAAQPPGPDRQEPPARP